MRKNEIKQWFANFFGGEVKALEKFFLMEFLDEILSWIKKKIKA